MINKITINELRVLVRNIINEEMSNYYQGLQPKEAINKAKVEYNFAIKNNNDGQANKITSNLKQHLNQQQYDWKRDPQAMDILSDFI